MLVAPLGLSWPVLPGNGSLPRLHKIPAHCGRNGYWGCPQLGTVEEFGGQFPFMDQRGGLRMCMNLHLHPEVAQQE